MAILQVFIQRLKFILAWFERKIILNNETSDIYTVLQKNIFTILFMVETQNTQAKKYLSMFQAVLLLRTMIFKAANLAF